MHQAHGDTLSCQVCHSITYTSCDGCHVAVSETSGNPFFETEATYMTFLIGHNPNPTEERPYKYVPVRHVPVAATSYQFYGDNLLSNFNELPTWVYATPHNIQKNTPQNASCQSCHGSDGSIFLTVDKVSAEELEANQDVIVNIAPPAVELFFGAPYMPASHLDLASDACTACHTTVKTLADVEKIRMTKENYDGSTDAAKPMKDVLKTFETRLFAAIQKYAKERAGVAIAFDEASHPYFFLDKNGDGKADTDDKGTKLNYNAFTPRLIKATYNYQYALKDPGAFAHNPKYVLQALYDSIQDIGGDLTGLVRPQ